MQFPDLPIDASPSVSFYFEDVSFELPDTEAAIAAWLFQIGAAESVPFRDISYIFCSDEYLRKVNIEYLNHDYYTDIITFPVENGAIQGDLYISSERVADNARSLDVPFSVELYRVMAHGVLHLCGYGDKTPGDMATMREKEDYYLGRIFH